MDSHGQAGVNQGGLNILLVEDDEDDYILARELLVQSFSGSVLLEWTRNYDAATQVIKQRSFDVCLVDFYLGDRTGLDLIQHIINTSHNPPPVILLTGNESREADLQAQRAGAADYLVKNGLDAGTLERSIRYALSHSRAERALRESEIRHRTVLDTIAEGVLIIDAQERIESVNPSAAEMFGMPEAYLQDKKLSYLLLENYRSAFKAYIRKIPLGHERGVLHHPLPLEVEAIRKDQSVFPAEITISAMRLGGSTLYICVMRDITQRKQREEELRLTATAFETHTAILISDPSGKILRVNPAFTQITGYESKEVLGKNPRILQSGHHDKAFYTALWHEIMTKGKWEGEIWNKRKNGEIYPEWQAITAVKDEQGVLTHYVATFQDITERKHAQALIEHQALYDSLTNLPNRRLLLDRLNQELSGARRRNTFGALLFLDLDHFKTLNDSLGHAAGDALLQQMARRLISNVRLEDTVSRLGGDEFVVLLPNLNQDEAQATEFAKHVAEKIRKELGEPYNLLGNHYNFTPSIGVTLFPFENDCADDVLKHADTAMYRAKSRGRNAVSFYQPIMQAEADRRLQLEKELRSAIVRQDFSLYYQPQFDSSGAYIGCEALLRWMHETRGMMAPLDFVPLAEETGLINALGDWVLQTAIQDFIRWRNAGLLPSESYISVNVSPRQFQQDEFVSRIEELLKTNDIHAHNIKLEITENILMADLQEVVRKMAALKKLGVTFSMDDFGTGFSSLSYLKRLPFDQIKIDHTFVKDVTNDLNDAAIVESIIAMADHLKLDVIAEGVESEAELLFLQEKGCPNYQGFLFSVPLDCHDFERFLHSKSSRALSAGGR